MFTAPRVGIAAQSTALYVGIQAYVSLMLLLDRQKFRHFSAHKMPQWRKCDLETTHTYIRHRKMKNTIIPHRIVDSLSFDLAPTLKYLQESLIIGDAGNAAAVFLSSYPNSLTAPQILWTIVCFGTTADWLHGLLATLVSPFCKVLFWSRGVDVWYF